MTAEGLEPHFARTGGDPVRDAFSARRAVMPWRSRQALPAEERVFWGVLLSVAWTLAVTLALAAADRYRFVTLLAVNATASAALLLAFRGRLRLAEPAGSPTAGALAPVALVALGLWMHPIASEYVMGGKDPGTYMNEGIQIAQRGGLVIHDPVVAAVPSATQLMAMNWACMSVGKAG